MDNEILQLQAANKALASEVNRLRSDVADKEYEAGQLDKQIRRLERKIEAVEDAQSKKPGPKTLTKGFFKPAGTEAPQRPEADRPKPVPKPKLKPAPGAIIDSFTGEEVDPAAYWPDEDKEKNLILRSSTSPEAELMKRMQNPPEINSDFDNDRYAKLVSSGRQQEAQAMIEAEGGPSLDQMQRGPLELLRKTTDLDSNWCDPSLNDCSLLQWACSMGYADVARELLGRRADPSHANKKGVSCLSTACAHNWLPCTELLLEARADPNDLTEPTGRQTLLMWTSRIDFADAEGNPAANPFLEVLLRCRADVNSRDHRGQTALMHATTHGGDLAVERLLLAKADADVEDKDGKTALKIALQYYHGKISSLLIPAETKKS